MSDFAKMFSKPIVLAGGAALGLVLLLSKHNAPNAANTDVSINPAYLSATVQGNADAMKTQVALATISGDVAKARIGAQVTETGFAFNLLNTQVAASAMVQRDQIVSSAGIVQTSLMAQSAQIIDSQNNTARLGLAQIEASRSVTVAGIQADTTKYVAKKQSSASIVSSIFGAVSKVASSAIGAATGNPGMFIGGGNNNGTSVPANTPGAGINWGGTPIDTSWA